MIKIKTFDKLADKSSIQKAAAALKKNGIEAIIVKDKEEAKKKVVELIPKGAEVMNMTSVTLDTAKISDEILAGNYNAVRNKLNAMNKEKQGSEMRKIGAGPDYTIGSVHAVTEDGKILVASNTGSQLPAYAYGAENVIWVVGAQKIVKDLDEGMKRIYEYVFLLEDKRAQKAYGVHTNVSKILIINKEINPKRITLIIVEEVLGF